MKNIEDNEGFDLDWETSKDELRVEGKFDVIRVKHLIYDTYQYFYQYSGYNSVLRGDLDVYRDICELACIGEYPKDCRQYEFDCCMDFVEGLLYAIELGFPRGYNQIALHVGLNEHMAGGGGRDADMSSYESFSRDFYKEMKFHLSDAFEDDTTDYENIMEEMFPDKFDITDVDIKKAYDHECRRIQSMPDDRITAGSGR